MALEPQARPEAPATDGLEGLSALLDGECGPADAAAFARRWRQDVQVQQHWDTYHLIGDSLRSEDLCRHVGQDRFMSTLRERLAAEPVVLAPAPLSTRRALRARWMRPVSAAAGVVAVAGSVWLLPVRQGGPVASVASSGTHSAPIAALAPGNGGDKRARTGGDWNRYLAAHQQFPAAAAVVPVSGYLRPADHDTADH